MVKVPNKRFEGDIGPITPQAIAPSIVLSELFCAKLVPTVGAYCQVSELGVGYDG